ncbi:hypothetical protein FACS189451_12610 [Bacteroidia bacterium]|nr:hypothetical protein FACS189451_12610 [Bacteroidia bacterium]
MTSTISNNKKDGSVYVDTNVLRNFFTEQPIDVDCLRFVFSKRKKEKLFTSSFAVGQVLSGLQKSSHNRAGFSKEKTIEKGKYIYQKFSLIDFTGKDLIDSFELHGKDVEDNVHYLLSQKRKCKIIITHDKTDFSKYGNVFVVKPSQLSYLKTLID